jgi:O-antigen/teichoic acid export membrane protein
MSYASDSIRTILVRFLVIGVALVGGIINARWLGPDGVGIYMLLILIPRICFRFGNLGAGAGISFFVARKQASVTSMIRFAVGLSMIMSTITALLVVTAQKWDWSPWHDIADVLFWMALIAVPLVFCNSLLQRIFGGLLLIPVINSLEMLVVVVYIILLTGFVILLDLGVMGALGASLMSQTIGLCYLLYRLRGLGTGAILASQSNAAARVANPLRDLLSRIFRYSIFNYFTQLIHFCFEQLPFIILKVFSSSAAVGIYSVPNTLLQRIEILPNTFSNLLFPFTAASGEQAATNRTNVLCRNFLLLMIGITVILALTGKHLILGLYGAPFAPSIDVLYALLPSLVALPVFRFLSVHVSASGNPKAVLLSRLAVFPAAVFICFLLIPSHGALGAAYSFSAGYMLLAAAALSLYLQSTKSRLSDVLIVKKADISYYRKMFRTIVPR